MSIPQIMSFCVLLTLPESETQVGDKTREVLPISALAGFVIDVSGSMRESIRNGSGRDVSRLGGFREVFLDARRRTTQALHDGYPGGFTTDILIFMYAFGLRGLEVDVCDVLALAHAAERRHDTVVEQDPPLGQKNQPPATDAGDAFAQLDRLAAEHRRRGWGEMAREYLESEQSARNMLQRLRAQPALAQELSAFLPNITQSDVFVARFAKVNPSLVRGILAAKHPVVAARAAANPKQVAKLRAFVAHLARPYDPSESEAENIARLKAAAAEQIGQLLASAPETTLVLEDVVKLLESAGDGFANLEDYLYGRTPMRAVMREVTARVARERAQRENTTSPVIVVVSDGQSTDGDPSESFDALKRSGAVVICCYVTGHDLGEARTLHATAHSDWDAGAKLLFQAASPASPGDGDIRFLEANGWTVEPGARYFLQANHSNHVSDLVEMVLHGPNDTSGRGTIAGS